MNQNRNGSELVVGVIVTYILFRLWWGGYLEQWGIEFLSSYVPSVKTYGNASVVGTLLIEAINVMVFVGTAATWALTGIWTIIVDCVRGLAAAAAYFRENVDLPSWSGWGFKANPVVEPDPRQKHAEALVKAAIEGKYVATVMAAESLHGKPFFPREEKPQSEPKAKRKATS